MTPDIIGSKVFDAALYETSLVGTITAAFPDWKNVAAFGGNLDVLDDLAEQTIITVGEFDYGLPNLPDELQRTLDPYNAYVEITGYAYLTQPLDKQGAYWALKNRVAQLMSLIPQINIDGGQRVFAQPLDASPLFDEQSPIAAYVLRWFDIVECSTDVDALTPDVPTGVITRVGIDVTHTLE